MSDPVLRPLTGPGGSPPWRPACESTSGSGPCACRTGHRRRDPLPVRDRLLHRPPVHHRGGRARAHLRHGRRRRRSISTRPSCSRPSVLVAGHLDVHRERATPAGTSSCRSTAGAARAVGTPAFLSLHRSPGPAGFIGHNPLAGLTYTLVFDLLHAIVTHGPCHLLGGRSRRLAVPHLQLPDAALGRRAVGALDPSRQHVALARVHGAPRLQRSSHVPRGEARRPWSRFFPDSSFSRRKRWTRSYRVLREPPQGRPWISPAPC